MFLTQAMSNNYTPVTDTGYRAVIQCSNCEHHHQRPL